jgi:hypothetical protein
MQLAPSILKELTEAIWSAVQNDTSFPLIVNSGKKFTHKITKEKSSGNLITTINQGETTYLIYLVKGEK